MARIVIYSIPFGLGPTGKALVIASHLKIDHSVTVASFMEGAHLAHRSADGIGVLNCSSRQVESLATVLDDADVFISVMDLQLAYAVKKAYPKIRVVFVDSLLSWRLSEYEREAFAGLVDIDLYIAQYFPGVSSDAVIAKFGNALDKLHVVQPFVHSSGPSNQARDGILVHLGGISSPRMNVSDYSPFLMATADAIVERWLGITPIVFAGCSGAMSFLRKRFPDPRLRFECLPYEDFQCILSHVKMLITTPGIETVYESVASGTALLLLPPLNSTQLLQTEEFRRGPFPSVLPQIAWLEMLSILQDTIEYSAKTKMLCSLVNQLAMYPSFQTELVTKGECVFGSNIVDGLRVPDGLEDGLSLIRLMATNAAMINASRPVSEVPRSEVVRAQD